MTFRYILSSAALLACTWQLRAQESCCLAAADFTAFAADKSFVAAHAEPSDFRMSTQRGANIVFPATDGSHAHAYYIQTKSPSDQWLIIIHEWWGLNDQVRQQADEYFAGLGESVNVLAVDLYDRKVATTREDASRFMNETSQERIKAILGGAIKMTGKKARIATLGWCLGGTWSMQTALMAEARAAACVIYYGMPEEDTARLKTLEAPVVMIYGKKDKWINGEVVAKFEKNMKAAGKPLVVYGYDADHAFANPSNPQHDTKAAADAFAKSLSFIKKELDKKQ